MSTIKTTTLSTQGGSTVPVDTVVNGTAKAWVNFDGTGTVAIRRAFNVSSISDNGTGDYSVNFTTAMVDADYSAIISTDNGSSGTGVIANFDVDATATPLLVGSVRIQTANSVNPAGNVNPAIVTVAIFS
mgnify:FL=1